MLTIMFDPIYSPAQVKYEKYELGRIEPQLMFNPVDHFMSIKAHTTFPL